jgi:hypothetical protein
MASKLPIPRYFFSLDQCYDFRKVTLKYWQTYLKIQIDDFNENCHKIIKLICKKSANFPQEVVKMDKYVVTVTLNHITEIL